ncbi:hypothetical protein [Dinghuibacter silviterrae]|uniref:YD repeat-containing protein n=1 Tax=Dinghuibacter silviterrae TaxID=1539049 RepID=A0A4R8DG53_9BACT|nr:hypothetical protein [Dinghuibacter silviterrae]TDW96338.1 hypothetical protein EDB95_4166 [Dinghuibacter silviterrae]
MRPLKAITLVFILVSTRLSAQFYYKDILSTQETGSRQQLYRTNHVRKVTVRNYNPDGSEVKDFVCQQDIDPSFASMVTLTSAASTAPSTLTSFFGDGLRLARSTDSSADAVTTTLYTYSPSGNLLSIRSESRGALSDTVHHSSSVEVHNWEYSPTGQPTGMLDIKNGTDTTWVSIKTDDQGTVTDELTYRAGSPQQHYFYYYDDAHHLTDIVRYNAQLQRMVPDYMFEYDETGKLDQMMIVQMTDNNYLVWRYQYDANGLRDKELCYDKTKQLLGSIGYEYTR